MTAAHLQTLRDAVPFRPFRIHLADGRTLHVPHRDYLSMSPSGRIVIVYRPDDTFSFVDLCLVTEIAVEPTSVAGNVEGG